MITPPIKKISHKLERCHLRAQAAAENTHREQQEEIARNGMDNRMH